MRMHKQSNRRLPKVIKIPTRRSEEELGPDTPAGSVPVNNSNKVNS